ncbi:ATP-citrate synthase alpha chain [Artemisia annua]|uniref:ATP-citrate synthase alpha chain n=1 Tax=Artemisia annua TaxID=35608 RepID=A0A2U1MFF0_ARTAN|nr:ATP-citrate synthase alpha chain [Artemisia annua]
MNPFTLVDGKPYPLDMRGELDDTTAFKNFKSATESFIHGLDEKTSASLKFTVLNPLRLLVEVPVSYMLTQYVSHSYILKFTVLNPFNVSIMLEVNCATTDPDGQKRALVVGGGIANFNDVAATFNGIIRAMKENVSFKFRRESSDVEHFRQGEMATIQHHHCEEHKGYPWSSNSPFSVPPQHNGFCKF